MAAKYKRVLLKLGGEALASPGGYGISPHIRTTLESFNLFRRVDNVLS